MRCGALRLLASTAKLDTAGGSKVSNELKKNTTVGRGRPRLEENTISVQVRMPETLARKLEQYATDNGMSSRQQAAIYLLNQKLKNLKLREN